MKAGDKMAYSEAQKRASAKYNAKAYDRIEVKVPKGRKAELQSHAESRGESLNGFVNRAIDDAVQRDTNTSDTDTKEINPTNTGDADA